MISRKICYFLALSMRNGLFYPQKKMLYKFGYFHRVFLPIKIEK